MPQVFRAVAFVVLLAPALVLSASQDPIAERAQAQAKEALSLASSPRSAAPLIQLQALREDVESLEALSTTYATLANKPQAHPLVRNLARLFAADMERAKGRPDKAAEWLAPMGFVNRFYVVGAFDNEGKAGCDVAHGPEQEPLQLSAAYQAKAREVSWRKLELTPPDGYVDLSSALRPQREAVVYALTFLEAAQDTQVELGLGTSGAYRLFVNGKLAAKEDRYNIPRPDQSRVAVGLRKGSNRVLLKVCQESGPLGFYLRQTPAPGKVSAKAVLPDALPPLPAGAAKAPVKATPLPTLASLLAAEVKKQPKNAQLRAAYATVLAHTRAYEERDRIAAAEARQAAELAPKDAQLNLHAAELERDDQNVRRMFLQRALAEAPKEPRVLLEMAEHELTRDHPERALPLLQTALEKAPDFVAAKLLQARAYEALGEWPRAAALLEEAHAKHPKYPRLAREVVRVSRRLDRFDSAVERLRHTLALRDDDGQSRRALAGLLADLSRVPEAEKELRRQLTQDPFDNTVRIRLADLLASNGRNEDAYTLYDAAIALSPDEPEVHEAKGRALLLSERRDEAFVAFSRSLELRPQNPRLKEVLRTLKSEGPGLGTRHALDVAPLLKETGAYAATEDAVYVVDNTYVRVDASGLSSRFQQFAVKVLTDRGVESFRNYGIGHAPSRQEVRILRARILKPDGAVVESHGESERAVNEPWSGMYYDTRSKQLSFPTLAKGDVLEVWYRLDDTARDNLLSDYWGDVESIQSTHPKIRYQYLVDMPKERPLFWNKSRVPQSLKATQDSSEAGRTLYRFSSENVKKLVPEPAMPGWAEVAHTLHVSTYKTWEDVGRYYWGLVRDQLTPDQELEATVQRALKGVDRKNHLAVVRALYNFVVTNTRYVALEFGIHGYKPYRVDRILARRFGDCKDKASLIHAMLKVAGVDSRLVLLRMRHLGNIGEEPASLAAFNHAILYVPQFDLYLDGTAEFHGAKELPTSDRAANVLVVEPDGKSTFRTIPEAKPEDNTTQLSMRVTLKRDGAASFDGESTVTGVQAPEYRRSYQAEATRRATFERAWAQTYPGLKVDKVGINDLTLLDDDVKLKFQMSAPRFAESLPQGLRFFPFGSGTSYMQRFAPLAERSHDVLLSSPSVSRFSYRFKLPTGATVEDLPAPLEEKSPYGTMTLKHRLDGGELVSEGEVVLSQPRIGAKDYAAFRAFLGRVDQAFSRKLLVRVPSTSQKSAALAPTVP